MSGEITQWLHRLRSGDGEALDELIPLIYTELQSIAHKWLHHERAGHTLSTTALVNEAYLKLVSQRQIQSEDRVHFFAVAGNTMRRILVDYARTRKRLKRGGGSPAVSFDEVKPLFTLQEADEVLALDQAIDRLAAAKPRAAEVVQHRFYAGLTLGESAELLGVSSKTVQRDWIIARAWLRKEIAQDLED